VLIKCALCIQSCETEMRKGTGSASRTHHVSKCRRIRIRSPEARASRMAAISDGRSRNGSMPNLRARIGFVFSANQPGLATWGRSRILRHCWSPSLPMYYQAGQALRARRTSVCQAASMCRQEGLTPDLTRKRASSPAHRDGCNSGLAENASSVKFVREQYPMGSMRSSGANTRCSIRCAW